MKCCLGYTAILPMPLFAFGVNHRTAPVDVRERISFPPEQLPAALQNLAACRGVKEAAILSTCNRTDLYCGLSTGDGVDAMRWFTDSHQLSPAESNRYVYIHRSESAVRHIMRVASGLDSMVLGEPQILGQIKSAYHAALKSGTVGQILGRLFQYTFSVAKRVRTDTAIGSSPVSVAFAAVSLAKQIFGELSTRTALLIGAGETIELAARHFKSSDLGRMVIANRTLENAHRLATEFDGYAISLSELPAHLGEADIIVSSTGSPGTIVSLHDVDQALGGRKHRPVFIVDVAVPRDIDPAVGEREDIYLYSVDDLADVIQENMRSRRDAAKQAEEIIDTQVSHFMGWLGALDVVDTIREVRTGAEETRDEVLRKAQRMLARGTSPDAAMEYLARTLTNKLLHAPSVRLRQAGSEGRQDIVEAAHVLFELLEKKHGGSEE